MNGSPIGAMAKICGSESMNRVPPNKSMQPTGERLLFFTYSLQPEAISIIRRLGKARLSRLFRSKGHE